MSAHVPDRDWALSEWSVERGKVPRDNLYRLDCHTLLNLIGEETHWPWGST